MNYSWWVYQTNKEQMVDAIECWYIERQWHMFIEWLDDDYRDELKAEIADLMKRP